jgi:hypothetical protein
MSGVDMSKETEILAACSQCSLMLLMVDGAENVALETGKMQHAVRNLVCS